MPMKLSFDSAPSVRLAPVETPPRSVSSTRMRRLEPPDGPAQRAYLFPNDYTLVSYYVTQLLEPKADGLEPQDCEELGLALRELLLNAIEHGNLGFGYAEKSRSLDAGDWKQRVTERQRQSEYADRQIEVCSTWERDRVVIVIRDEGPGFDWRDLPDPTDPDNLLVAHGRGVLMARLSVDSLRYNDAGNEVTIVKLLTGIPESQRVAG